MTRFPPFKLSRRQFLAASSAAGLIGLPAMGAEPQVLRAEPGLAQLGPVSVGPANIWGYNGKVPGPTLRVKQGERVRVRLDNALDQPTTIHWHGIRIDNAMDGVAHLTQAPVPPGESFTYDFVVPDAGTYWYHPHNRTWEQMARGLYGALIVEEAEPPHVDDDITLILDDWQLNEDGDLDAASLGSDHEWAHAGRIGNWLTVNGQPQPEFEVALGARLRLRLINTANSRIMELGLTGMDAAIVAYDGQPVPPEPLTGDISLSPGQRVDLIADVTASEMARLILRSGGGDLYAASFPVKGAIMRLVALGPVAPLPANPLPRILAMAGNLRADLIMQGGAMRWLAEAEVGGGMSENAGMSLPKGRLSGRDLMPLNLFWSLNGIAGMPDAPMFTAARGQTVVINLVNDTLFPHAMHLHGHHALDQRTGHWRDTVLSQPGERHEVSFVADNPGDWMIHCHMLEHQAAGMSTWFRVS